MDPDATTLESPADPDTVGHVVVMGVSGSGKTTVATHLADRLGVTSAEGDEFHPAANLAKMAAGTPLTDADRAPWLATIRDWLSAEADAGRPGIVTCSALRRAYRDVLRDARGQVRFVHLDGPPELLAERMGGRTGHFMPATLLSSQLATLEPLQADEDGIVVGVAAEPADIVDTVVDRLDLA
ncbi:MULTISPECIES: gluconokinase [unclassified Isoptericola]|uniref:gluconokinase n=1 Tax=unclassified Isoptericola TaxID=2623355 RepID=UPI002712F296|nr:MULTISPECIES: gluconokinase [unclassified Isoptericola]MDO8146979.1 gluconokinase [Isoptericola sp. b515]MDO8150706.1 gluconokinase [Isoptericola sp. b408]